MSMGEQYNLNTSVKNLVNHHLFLIFEKENDAEKLSFRHKDLVKGFENLT
jgi:hypothetical protein